MPSMQYRLRTLLLMVALISLALGGLRYQMDQARIQREIVAQVRRLDGLVAYDDLTVARDMLVKPSRFRGCPARWLGHDFVASAVFVYLPDGITDSQLPDLKKLAGLHQLSLNGPGITDNCVEKLEECQSLRSILLKNTAVTPGGIKRIRRVIPGIRIQEFRSSGEEFRGHHINRVRL